MQATENSSEATLPAAGGQLTPGDRKILQDAISTLEECGLRMAGMERTVVLHVGAQLRNYLQRVGSAPNPAAQARPERAEAKTGEAPRFSIDADNLDNLVVGIVSGGKFLTDPTQLRGSHRQMLDALPRLNEIFREEGREACLAAISAEEDRVVRNEADPLKRFSATWDASFNFVGTKTLAVAAFSPSRGYSREDFAAINALEVGQKWRDPQYGTSHTVTRLPDLQSTTQSSEDEEVSHGAPRSRMRM